MYYLLAGILVLATVIFVLYPLKKEIHTKGLEKQTQDTITKRETALLSLIDELETDFDIGIVSQGQYGELKNRYLSGLGVLVEEKGSEVNEVYLEDVIEAAVKKLREQEALVCPQCGDLHNWNDRFCGQCGQRLSSTGSD